MTLTFAEFATASQQIKTVVHAVPTWSTLDPISAELVDKAVEFIAGVLTRGGGSTWAELGHIVSLAQAHKLMPTPIPSKPVPPTPIEAIRRQSTFHNPTTPQQTISAVEAALGGAES